MSVVVIFICLGFLGCCYFGVGGLFVFPFGCFLVFAFLLLLLCLFLFCFFGVDVCIWFGFYTF